MAYYLQNPRMAWTDEEDQCLRAAVARYGVKRWAQISALLPGRTSKACSHRWRTYLQPGVMHTSTNPFTDWEVAVVKEAHRVLGNNWSAIARMLPGRTNAAVKNFWYAYKRRSQRAHGRGHTRHSDAADLTAPSAAGDADDEELCDADMDDADLDFADIDDADVDLDFGDEGDTACEELDEDETLLPEDLTGADAHLVEGAAMHVGAYSMSGLPMGSWGPSDIAAPAHSQHQQPLKQEYGAAANAGYMDMSAALNNHEDLQHSQITAVDDSAQTSPTIPQQRTVEFEPVKAPAGNSYIDNATWSTQQHMQQVPADRPTDHPGSPAVPPTRESAAGAPPGTASVGVYPGSPMVTPNGHSCAGAPSGTGSATGTTFLGSPVVPPFGQTAATFLTAPGPGDQATLSGGQVMMETLGDLGASSDPLLSDISGPDAMNSDLLLTREHSDCLVNVHGPGVTASQSALLDNHLLPFSGMKTNDTCLPNKQQQSPGSSYGYQSHAGLATTSGQTAAQLTAAIAAASPAGFSLAACEMQREDFGVAQLADFPQLQLQAGQKRRVSYMHGCASQIADSSKPYAKSVTSVAGHGHAAFAMHTASNYSSSSCSNSSNWIAGVQQQEQMMSRQSYCSDGGVGSSGSGQDNVVPGPFFHHQQHHHQQQQQQQQQLSFAYPGDQASRFLKQQQMQPQQQPWLNTSNTHGNVTTITTAAVPVHQQPEVLQQQQQQRQQQAAKRFCLDLSDEALAAEISEDKHR